MQESTNNQPADSSSWPGPLVAWFTLGVLVFAFIFSIADRVILSLLVDPIKADLQISDTQMGLIMGPLFAVFYALMGLPIGRLVDKYSRRAIIGMGVFFFSIMTALCGLAQNMTQLVLARVGLGVGSAALSPAAYSMIADIFPRDKLGRALGIYQSGAFLGIGAAMFMGGLAIKIAERFGGMEFPLVGALNPWQISIILIGLPGVLVAVVMLFVLEPVRQGISKQQDTEVSFGQAFAYVFSRWRVYVAHYTGFALLGVPMTTLAVWVPAYLQRVHDLSRPESGFMLGLIVLCCAPIGVIAGGWLADTLFKQGWKDAPLRVGLMAAVFMVPVSFFATVQSDLTAVYILLCLFAFGASISMGLAPTALQLITPNRLRGQVGALWMLFLNVVTACLGPWLVPQISDSIYQDPMRIGDAMQLVNTASVILGGLIIWATWKPFRAAVDKQSV
jgi:MFS family permease